MVPHDENTGDAAAQSYPWHGPVPHGGTDADLQALRKLLADYTAANLCARLKVPNLQAYVAPSNTEPVVVTIETPLDVLIRLFLDCRFLPEAALSAGALALLDRMGLIGRAADYPGSVYARAAILPVGGEWIVFDRGSAPDGSRGPLPPDVIYPPIFDNTRHFLASLPTTPCDAMLDLGTGTGVAALAGARHARQVWATDITARAAAFADLNRRLAALSNITVLEGDLFQPVEGLTFDRIVMYPPYVPARQSKFVYRDGGEDGTAIIRRVVHDLPRFLRKGGRFYATMLAADRQGETFEQRVRGWLGDAQAQFDIGVAARTCQSPTEFLAHYVRSGAVDADDLSFWNEMWRATKTEHVLYASLVLSRHDGSRDPATVRVLAGKGYTSGCLDDLLDWEAALQLPGSTERLLAARPKANPQSRLKTASRIHEGSLVIDQMALETEGPFRDALACDWWVAQLLCRCDGSQTVGELFAWARGAGLIPETAPVAEFAGALATLVRKGLVDTPPVQ